MEQSWRCVPYRVDLRAVGVDDLDHAAVRSHREDGRALVAGHGVKGSVGGGEGGDGELFDTSSLEADVREVDVSGKGGGVEQSGSTLGLMALHDGGFVHVEALHQVLCDPHAEVEGADHAVAAT
jgi:hypothetical protein